MGTVDTQRAYTYNGNAAGQPDTLTKVATTGPGGTSNVTSTVDAAGQTGVRTTTAGAQTFTFDAEHHLASVTGPAGTSSYLRDANGNLLIRRQPGTTTLSLPGMELALNTTTSTVVGTRYYQHPGAPTGVRTGSTFAFLISDPHGSSGLTLDATAQLATYRSFTPFGGARGTRGTWPDPHDFLGLPTDSAQGLDLLGARQYDPVVGRFLSVDPELDTGDPQSLSGYAYANSNPIGGADPSGLRLTSESGGGGCSSNACIKKVNAYDAKHTTKHVWPPPVDEGALMKQMAAEKAARDAAAKAAEDRPWWEAVLPIVASIAVAVVVTVAVVGVCSTGVGCVLLAGAVAGAAGSAAGYGAEVVEGVHSFDVGDFAKTVGLGAIAGVIGAGAGAIASKAAGAVISRVGSRFQKVVSCALSFSPDTQVVMADGTTKPIASLAQGDQVASNDTKTAKTRTQPVQAVWINHDTDLLDVVVRDAHGGTAVVHATAKHPIWDQTLNRWVTAARLTPGHLLRTVDGQTARVQRLVTPKVTTGDMWDLTIDTDHDFYIKAGTTTLLVHNCGDAAESGLLAQANAVRDIKVAQLSGASAADRTESSTVVGAYNIRTGSVGVGTSSKLLSECAEACAARAVGGNISDIRFTQALRPRGSGAAPTPKSVCAQFCEPTYGRGAFPDPATIFESDG